MYCHDMAFYNINVWNDEMCMRFDDENYGIKAFRAKLYANSRYLILHNIMWK